MLKGRVSEVCGNEKLSVETDIVEEFKHWWVRFSSWDGKRS